jgi:hypothetical protein
MDLRKGAALTWPIQGPHTELNRPNFGVSRRYGWVGGWVGECGGGGGTLRVGGRHHLYNLGTRQRGGVQVAWLHDDSGC